MTTEKKLDMSQQVQGAASKEKGKMISDGNKSKFLSQMKTITFYI